ncbi:PTS sugar transporter subunit IIA [Listeria seeligeri]|uniref:PTS glucose transporter subunit IIA n=3 Tax=Listeria seeligeri TaxID=1640 RepID=A0A7X0X2M7_LISSE|nr:PTS glucose transporter subunit IIA [Listeria seeligeri]EFS01588.1 pts system glucoside-specific eiicba component [Listeria seeligeri FSL N1-067]KKD46278.1 PTS sugar transporter subunit IIA [Listeria seeligeri]MBC1486489.1 PTS glucose transporter subunit IIA [Listeria seeligeri]MBC1577878.1 PTS glucose transporter subunit IIA [Listeria seeligeri]MBC1579143.1 PTS glucose transporter subunit IIA [Listeria seeligeri]
MFQKFKKKKKNVLSLLAPINGTCISLSEVPDEVFSSKMMGDGVAIKPTSNKLFAPTDGKVTFIAETKHAIGFVTTDGQELLIHVGLDTVSLNGEGFSLSVEVNQEVRAGEQLLSFNQTFIEDNQLNLITPIILLENKNLNLEQLTIGTDVIAGETIIINCTQN